ncbi:VOC family protein [Cellulomonas wangsupingiae]|uniref:VOC family protein n=1 Tax=Cellulomonas wangsupingiae TaxID=2968085 RepID=A0ABY5K2X4_9CELL|nr:VOC family protein [Cellulomonas wangsupingiae]MCC2336075.1 VOC family protein [Cellulomonas wangsupingiae]UUI64797.1 VOC family protein [Cellulomonas wangsupingiae]
MPTPTARTHDDVLAPATAMDAVTLHVGDLKGMATYYADALALEPLEERGRGRHVHRVLGRGATPLLRLVHTPGLPAVDPRQAGLFHTAFLFDDAAGLAATVYRAAQDPRSRFVGSSDHLVSEAFYFTDPEGNGIELYTDRDRDLWLHRDGNVVMGTEHLDPNAYLREHLTQEAVDAGPALAGRVGHVHLQVGDIATAEAFYLDALGFEATVRGYPGALFASAGGYHHHVAMNTWNSRGAGPRASTLGLGDVAVTVPARDDLDALVGRLRARGLAFADDGRSVSVRDPWDTQVTVSLPGTTTEDLLAR